LEDLLKVKELALYHLQSDSVKSLRQGEVWLATAYFKAFQDYMRKKGLTDITELEIKND
jgi:spermidine/putrescine-binding protein